MNFIKRGLALFLLASLTAGQAQAAPTDSISGAIAQMCSDKVTKLIENGELDIALFGAAMTSFLGLLTYLNYKTYKEDLSTRVISAPLTQLCGLGTIALGAATINTIYNA